MLKNIDNRILGKKITPTTKSPSSIIEKDSYADKKCDQLATGNLK